MRGVIRFGAMIFWAFCVFLTLNDAWALTPEQVISLKNAGVSDQTIQLMIRQEQDAAPGSPNGSSGRKEIRDKDGRTVIIYSTGRRAGDNRSKEELQTEKAWEMLKGLIIDTRKSK
ncbi:MAG: hypothetical protein ACYDAA_03670 [Syntrophales bacterium]